jgi:sporulation protein YlmC with PRC-barrel domain
VPDKTFTLAFNQTLALNQEDNMNRTLVVFAAVSGLTMSTALAQAPAPPSPAPAAPPAAASSKPGSSQIVNSQSKDEWLASKLKGTTVLGSDDQKIGSVADILLDKTGQVKAFVVGIGGVLGIGAKEIAVDMTQFHEVPAANGGQEQLKISMTKDQLAQADAFKPLPSPATTTGAAPGAPGGGSRPAGAPPPAPR